MQNTDSEQFERSLLRKVIFSARFAECVSYSENTLSELNGVFLITKVLFKTSVPNVPFA